MKFQIENAVLPATNWEIDSLAEHAKGLKVGLSNSKKGLNFRYPDNKFKFFGRFSNAVKEEIKAGKLDLNQVVAKCGLSRQEYQGSMRYTIVLPEELRGTNNLFNADDMIKAAKPIVARTLSVEDLTKMVAI